ncbi:MAG: SAM-dependent methyltransferase, partial [Patescibacteria group bacterium]|nr:SAM-dependent methyltransferase [Patescibacteria group bacterium]
MNDLIMAGWPDYELIDTGEGKRLERFGAFLSVRPDPNVIWRKSDSGHQGWKTPDLLFKGKEVEGGWEADTKRLKGWKISYNKATFQILPSSFR